MTVVKQGKTRNKWHSTGYPCLPRHKIVGKIVSGGGHVIKFEVGDLAVMIIIL
jgi:D-arabinose 1-dehydrogenase-like Zn-dependent alcohol dehydrogenase